MVGANDVMPDGAARPAQKALVARASLAYVRDNVQISCAGADLLTTLLFTAILDANMAPVNRDPELRLAYGDLEDSCPDELRRPVTINAMAASLRLPFETVRRRVHELIDAGDCVATAHGVYVPRSAVTSPAYKAIQVARYERVRAFHRTLRDVGELAADDPPGSATRELLVRAVNRVISEYMLRACGDLIALTHDMLGSVILMEVALDNSAELPPDRLSIWAEAPAALARPVRGSVLSARLGLSAETLRRHAIGLEATGFLRRTPTGMVAVCPASTRPRLAHLIEANVVNLHRLFARLRELGVTAGWEMQDDLVRTPAVPARRA